MERSVKDFEVVTVSNTQIIMALWNEISRSIVQCVHFIVSLRRATVTVTPAEFMTPK